MDQQKPIVPGQMELWAGAECTVNRVGDAFMCQLAHTGHHDRIGDLELIAGLGAKALRLPILWERVSPVSPDQQDWQWSDSRIARLRELAIRPIAGLVHHGSGPHYTSLVEDSFAPGLARHAAAVARRYPSIEEWTPVNEPLTTARFAALYGHWYPHLRDERAFWTALLNQVDGTRLAMAAVRQVNPAARLVQTDDLGRTYATGPLQDQAAFDNTRRWMTWDLLCGMVMPGHALWDRLCRMGFHDRLLRIADDPCPPDVIGINHYLTSDRFLDHRTGHYPGVATGGNGKARFVDVEAVRVLCPPSQGLAGALREAWDRYGIPIALTEVHNGSTREEQMRWLLQAWQAAREVRQGGVDVVAFTPWALFGNQGWNTLLTGHGRYEAGAFDTRGPVPHHTGTARLIRSLAGLEPTPTGAAGKGWWQRPLRHLHLRAPRPAPMRQHVPDRIGSPPDAPILITGATGTLGRALARACEHRNLRHVLTSRAELDLGSPGSIATALDRFRPWAVVNAAGWVRVDDAEGAQEACFEANATGAASLAAICALRGIQTASFSSDLVFDGALGRDYTEEDRAAPLNAYGRSKAAMEVAIAALPGDHLILRTAAFFSPEDSYNFAVHAARAAFAGRPFRAAADQRVSPTYVPHLCDATLDLLLDRAGGTWHLTNGRSLSWADFAREVVRACGLDPRIVEPVTGADLQQRAMRPAHAGLASARGALLPPLDQALHDFAAKVQLSQPA